MERVMGTLNNSVQNINAAKGNMPLSFFSVGESGSVRGIRGNARTVHFLENLGCVNGAKIRVMSQNGGNLIIKVKSARVGISKSMAARIIMEQ